MIATLKGLLKGLRIQDPTDRTKQLVIQIDPSATAGTTTTIVAAQTANRTIVLPDGGSFVTPSSTDTFTNKSMDGDTNTFSNIPIEALKPVMADALKVLSRDASGAVVSTAIPGLTSVFEDNAFKVENSSDNSKSLQFNLSTLTGAHSYTFPATNDELAGIAAFQVMQNKAMSFNTLDASNIVSLDDTRFTLENFTDPTKEAVFDLSAISPSTIRTITIPDADLTLTGTTTTQTLSNKTISDALTFTQISTPSNPSASNNKLYFKSDDSLYSINSSGTEVQYSSSIIGPSLIIGAKGVTISSATYSMTADLVSLKNSNNQIVIRTNTGAIINNPATAGPIANGRDQVGSFSNSSWMHFYFIWNGTTLATVSSTVAPPTGPTLPATYTHWAYFGSVYKDSSGNTTMVTQRGSWIYNNSPVSIGTSSSSTITTPSLAAIIPPNALSYSCRAVGNVVSSAGGLADLNYFIYSVSPTIFTQINISLTGLGTSQTQTLIAEHLILPNYSNVHTHALTTASGSSPSVAVVSNGYKIPNGGE